MQRKKVGPGGTSELTRVRISERAGQPMHLIECKGVLEGLRTNYSAFPLKRLSQYPLFPHQTEIVDPS